MENPMNFNERFWIRTKKFAIEICKYLENLPQREVLRNIIRQNIRSVTSVAANFRAACRARSDAEYYSKLYIVVEECDETIFWLELLDELAKTDKTQIIALIKEANELLNVFSSAKKKLKTKLTQTKNTH